MKESSRFYSSLVLLIILNAIIKPLWIFGIDREVQNIVGTESYGIYFSLLNFSIVFSFLLDWGLTSFFNRQLAAEHLNFIDKTRSFLFIKVLFSLFYAVIILGTGWMSGITHWTILLYVTGIQILTSFFVFLRSIITAQQWFVTDAWLSVLDKTLVIVLCGLLIYAPGIAGTIDLQRFLGLQLFSTGLAVMIAFLILAIKGVSFLGAGKLLGGFQFFKAALPFALTVLLMSMHYRLDGFLLERIHVNGAYEAGLYASAYRLLDASNMIGYLVASFLLPFIARQWSQGKNIQGIVLNSRHLLAVFSLVVIITTLFLAPWIEEILYRRPDVSGAAILQWTLPALLGYSLVQVYGTVLTATGFILIFCRINLVAVLINTLLNLILIPGWGAQGCCFAALISQTFCGIATLVYTNKKTGVPVHLPSFLMYIFIGGILCLFFWLTRDTLNNWLLMGAAAFITIVASVACKLVDPAKWRKLFKQNVP